MNAEEKSGYMGYEYREVMVPEEFVSLYMDSYLCFGWEPDEHRSMAPQKVGILEKRNGKNRDRRRLYFRRIRCISNKAELTRLQRNFDSCIAEIGKLKQSRTQTALIAAITTGIIGTAFMAGSVFAITGDSPVVWLMILLAVPGFTGWIAPYFLYQMLARKKAAEVEPLIEQKYDEIYAVCEKGDRLKGTSCKFSENIIP